MSQPATALMIGLLALSAAALLVWPRGGLLERWRHWRRLNERVLREDALKHLHRAERHNLPCTLTSLAGALQIPASQAALLANDMQAQQLLNTRGGTLQLTAQGRQYALQIIRAHRLWERYLAEETGYEEAEWHDLAERIEHRLTSEQAENLARQLGNPTHDPHGDPIPGADGQMVLHGGQPLPDLPLHEPVRIVHLEDEPETVYAQLVAEGLAPGMQATLTEISAQRVRFWAGGEEHVLAPVVAASISAVLEHAAQPAPALEFAGEPLYNLQPGETGEVSYLAPRCRGAERRRMLDLGVLPGTEIRAELSSPSGGLAAYRVRGALIALRKEQAAHILITRGNPEKA